MLETYIEFIQNNLILSITWLTLLLAIIFNFTQLYFSKIKKINAQDAILKINNNACFLIDTRTQNEYSQEHIIHSKNIEIEKIDFHLKQLKYDPAKDIILINQNGLFLHKIAKIFIHHFNLKNIYILDGGIATWKEKNFPLIKT